MKLNSKRYLVNFTIISVYKEREYKPKKTTIEMHTHKRYKLICGSMATLLLLLLPLLPGCGGKSGADSSRPADSTTTTATPAPQTTDAETDHALTSEGVERIQVGMQTAHIPHQDEGFYDSMEKEEGNESNTYLFLRGGNPLLSAYEFTEGTIDVVSAESPRIVVLTPDGGTLRLGDEFSRVLLLPGVTAEWENADDEGMWCWHWQGIWFQPDQTHLPEALSRELYSDVAPPSPESFTSEARIGYIGTGLPW